MLYSQIIPVQDVPGSVTWLRTIELDVQQFNMGLYSAYRLAQDGPRWRKLVGVSK